MTDISRWDDIKEFYKKSFGTPGWIVELMANMDILLLCASGAGNSTISKYLDIPLEDVVITINDTFGFTGWDSDLDIDPYKTYLPFIGMNYEDEAKEQFIAFISELFQKFDDCLLIYSICRTMHDIESKINDEWI